MHTHWNDIGELAPAASRLLVATLALGGAAAASPARVTTLRILRVWILVSVLLGASAAWAQTPAVEVEAGGPYQVDSGASVRLTGSYQIQNSAGDTRVAWSKLAEHRHGLCRAAAAAPGAELDLTVPVLPAGVDAEEGPEGTLCLPRPLVGVVPRLEVQE